MRHKPQSYYTKYVEYLCGWFLSPLIKFVVGPQPLEHTETFQDSHVLHKLGAPLGGWSSSCTPSAGSPSQLTGVSSHGSAPCKPPAGTYNQLIWVWVREAQEAKLATCLCKGNLRLGSPCIAIQHNLYCDLIQDTTIAPPDMHIQYGKKPLLGSHIRSIVLFNITVCQGQREWPGAKRLAWSRRTQSANLWVCPNQDARGQGDQQIHNPVK